MARRWVILLHAVLELFLSLLAVFGLFSLGWLAFGRILAPKDFYAPAYAVVPARGDGAALEQTVRALLWLRAGELRRYTVVIADDGLDPLGRAVANALVSREPRVIPVCLLYTSGEKSAFDLQQHLQSRHRRVGRGYH